MKSPRTTTQHTPTRTSFPSSSPETMFRYKIETEKSSQQIVELAQAVVRGASHSLPLLSSLHLLTFFFFCCCCCSRENLRSSFDSSKTYLIFPIVTSHRNVKNTCKEHESHQCFPINFLRFCAFKLSRVCVSEYYCVSHLYELLLCLKCPLMNTNAFRMMT